MQVLRDHVPSFLAHTNLQQAGGSIVKTLTTNRVGSGWEEILLFRRLKTLETP